jgi:hypothetical protein
VAARAPPEVAAAAIAQLAAAAEGRAAAAAARGCTCACARSARDVRLLLEGGTQPQAGLSQALAVLTGAVRAGDGDPALCDELAPALLALLSRPQEAAAGAELLLQAARGSGYAPPVLAAAARACSLPTAAATAAAIAGEALAAAGTRPTRQLLVLLHAGVSHRAPPFITSGALAAAATAAASALTVRMEGDEAEACGRAACALAAELLRCQEAAPHGVALVRALLAAAAGGLPPECVTNAAEAAHAGWVAAGDQRTAGWLRDALHEPPHMGASPAAREAFVAALLVEENRRDVRRFKRVLKAFCGGKKTSSST